MIKLLNLQEAKEWAEQNLYEADSFMFPLNVAVKRGLLRAVTKNCFIPVEYETNGCTWHLDEIQRLSDKEMKENDLYCRYRYKAHVINTPDNYSGVTSVSAGLHIEDELDERFAAGTRVYVEGRTTDLWILDFDGYVSSSGTVDKTPTIYDKKVMITLDEINGERGVGVSVRKSKLLEK